MNEPELLDAARRGDERAYGELVAPFEGALRAHCYRMLGSVQDSEDAVQDTLLRAWRAIGSFERRSSVRSWLYTIATNTCLRVIERRKVRALPIDLGPPTPPGDGLAPPLSEETWIEPMPDHLLALDTEPAGPEARYEQRESVELAFIAALQHLPARQRAVLILREVLGFSGDEVAAMLETSPASIYSAQQRARENVESRLPDISQQATLRGIADARLREIVDRYVDAWERNDVDALASMLTEGALVAMPPTPTWYRGLAEVTEGLRRGPLGGHNRWRVEPMRANGQLAVRAELWREQTSGFLGHHIAVLTLDGDWIAAIDAFHGPPLTS